MKEFDLLVIGEINPDLILTGDDIEPTYGQAEKLVETATLTIGSSSCIMACGAARLGLRTAFVGLVGDDIFGRFMLEALQERGIDTRGCVVDPGIQTGLSVILSRRGGDRAILTYRGSTSALRADHINTDFLTRARHLHVGGYFLLDRLRSALPELFGEARRRGLTTSLDTNWDPRGIWGVGDLLAHCDVFLPNGEEAKHISGHAQLGDALDALAERVPTVAVKMGAQGGLVRHGKAVHRSPPPHVEVVDTVGAGDSFDAGLLFGILNGWSLDRALRLAVVCGSLSTQRAGGTAGQPTFEEARQWLEK